MVSAGQAVKVMFGSVERWREMFSETVDGSFSCLDLFRQVGMTDVRRMVSGRLEVQCE